MNLSLGTFTVEQFRDYCEWHVQNGRGHELIAIDRRGLAYLEEKHHDSVTLGLPPPEDTHGDGKVYVRAVF